MVLGLCKYKDIFGKPGEDVHSDRIFTSVKNPNGKDGFATVDVVMTVIACLIIAYVEGWNPLVVLIVAILFSVLVHKAFCVDTTLTNLVFQ